MAHAIRGNQDGEGEFIGHQSLLDEDFNCKYYTPIYQILYLKTRNG